VTLTFPHYASARENNRGELKRETGRQRGGEKERKDPRRRKPKVNAA
jgi:hypothetical protein